MREGIHPEYVECKVTCSCGSTFTTRATKPELHIELCSACHPFYTGKQKFVDTGGRVQRFADKFGNAAQAVLERESAERDARQKAHEDSVAERLRAKADAEAKMTRSEMKAAREAAEATAVEEAPVEEPAAEEAPVEEAPVEEPAAEEAPAEEPAAEETPEESGE